MCRKEVYKHLIFPVMSKRVLSEPKLQYPIPSPIYGIICPYPVLSQSPLSFMGRLARPCTFHKSLNIAARKRRRRTYIPTSNQLRNLTPTPKKEKRRERYKQRQGYVCLLNLCGDEVTGHLCDETTTALVADGAEEADEVGSVGAESGNVIPLVVGVGAGECLAARYRGAAVEREDLLYAVGVIWVDDGRDIKVGGACEAIETDLAEHAWDVFGALGDGVPVANPAGWEGLVGGLRAGDDELGNALKTSVLGEDDGALSAVLVDEVDCASRGEGCKRGGCEDGAEELHLVNDCVDDRKVSFFCQVGRSN